MALNDYIEIFSIDECKLLYILYEYLVVEEFIINRFIYAYINALIMIYL
jgi:hypothetical protein